MQVKASHLAIANHVLTQQRPSQFGALDVDELHRNLVWRLEGQYLHIRSVGAVLD